jgi:hypothetical protein
MAQASDLSEQQFLREHRQSWLTFERVMLFATLHVALTLSCVALAFIGHIKVIASLLWLGGTIAVITVFAIRGTAPRDG